MIGDFYGFIKRDTRSLDYSSYAIDASLIRSYGWLSKLWSLFGSLL